jgi:hypothetical protein
MAHKSTSAFLSAGIGPIEAGNHPCLCRVIVDDSVVCTRESGIHAKCCWPRIVGMRGGPCIENSGGNPAVLASRENHEICLPSHIILVTT